MSSRSPGGLFARLARRWAGGDTDNRLDALERLLRKTGDAGREHADAVQHRVSELARAVAQQPTAKDLRELRQAVRSLAAHDERQLLEELEQIAGSGRPIVVGPWTGELGFELLYWIPFVEWVRNHWSLAPERQIVVSRGGPASWYASGDANYSDAFSFVTPDEFRAAVAAEKRKQRRLVPFDRQLIDAVVQERQLGDVDVLHPRLMYRLFAAFWSDDAGYARIDRFTRYRRLEPSARWAPAHLPAEYVAVRFYFSECFPETPENRAFAEGVVASLAERTSVIVLNPGFSFDDHADWVPRIRDRVLGLGDQIGDQVPPESNLAVQSAVVAGAQAFVGTYGGYSYLAPLHGVPAVAFFSRRSFKLQHLHAAERAFERAGAARLTPVDVAQAAIVQSALGAAVPAHS